MGQFEGANPKGNGVPAGARLAQGGKLYSWVEWFNEQAFATAGEMR